MTSLIPEVAADASGASAYAWLLIALPLLGAAILLLGGRRTDRFGPLLGDRDVLGLLRRGPASCCPARRPRRRGAGACS